MRKTWKKKVPEKACRDQQQSRISCRGGQIDDTQLR